MDGIHDLGGKRGFDAVTIEADEPAFHARWEAAVFAMVGHASAQGLTGNIDRFRHAVERIDPVAYLTHTYYGRWLGGLETALVEAGHVDPEEITARERDPRDGPRRIAARPSANPDRVVPATDPTTRRPIDGTPAFADGASVRTRSRGVAGHTRLPAYARGRTGTIVCCHAGWVFPDSHAHGHGEAPTWLYSVRFDGEELWGDDAEPGTSVCLDLFEPYLEAIND